MKKGFVFGKFLPFHLGHKALIDFALNGCDQLTVIVCCSTSELIPEAVRVNWISSEYASHPKLRILGMTYDENELPNTSTSSRNVSKVWSERFKELVPDVNILFTSEDYGSYVSEFMKVQHVEFDKSRISVPISASEISGDPISNWDFLPNSVKGHFQLSVVFLGSECTGKSSISTEINKNIRSKLVDEVGRDVVENSNAFGEKELQIIASHHASRIDSAKKTLEPIVLIDTDIHITQSYSHFKFGKYMDIATEINIRNQSDLKLYLNPDLPFFQDGTRLNAEDRLLLDRSHKETLAHFNTDYIEVSGDWNSRYTQSLKLIKQLVREKWKLRL